MAITNLEEIIKLILGWENKLSGFYVNLHKCLKNERSRKIITALKDDQHKTLEALKKIDVHKYKSVEFLKNFPDYHSEEVIPHVEINENSSPQEILEKILAYEEKLEEYYTHMRNIVVFEKSKELFDMLVQLKLGQIKRIKSFLDSYDMVM